MKFYTLTHVSFNQTANSYLNNLQSNLLLFSDKYDTIVSAKITQKDYIIKHLKETHDRKDVYVQETPTTCTTLNASNTYITAGNMVHLLIINTVEASPKTTTDTLSQGDFVTLTAEAVEALREMENSGRGGYAPHILKLAKVTNPNKSNNSAEIMICAVNTARITSTDYMGRLYDIPKEYLKKVYI